MVDDLPIVKLVISTSQSVKTYQRLPLWPWQRLKPTSPPSLADIDTGHLAEIGPETRGASHSKLGGIPWHRHRMTR